MYVTYDDEIEMGCFAFQVNNTIYKCLFECKLHYDYCIHRVKYYNFPDLYNKLELYCLDWNYAISNVTDGPYNFYFMLNKSQANRKWTTFNLIMSQFKGDCPNYTPTFAKFPRQRLEHLENYGFDSDKYTISNFKISEKGEFSYNLNSSKHVHKYMDLTKHCYFIDFNDRYSLENVYPIRHNQKTKQLITDPYVFEKTKMYVVSNRKQKIKLTLHDDLEFSNNTC